MSNWNICEDLYPGPAIEPVGWANIDGKQYPVYGFSLTSIDTSTSVMSLASPRTLANGDTLEFTTVTSITS